MKAVGADAATDAEVRRIQSYYRSAAWRPSLGARYLVDERWNVMQRLIESLRPPVESLRVCDVGCGAGADLERWQAAGVPASNLMGSELQVGLARAAEERVPGADIRVVAGFDLPFADGSADVVTATLVLSSIRHTPSRRALAREMRRVVRRGGLLAVYDFRVRKPWNQHVSPIRSSELASELGAPDVELRLAPFLPLLGAALALPPAVRRAAIAALPRTHRMWVWHG